MSNVLKFKEWSHSLELSEEFLETLCNPILRESSLNDSLITKIAKSLSRDLKFNISLVFTFGTGVKLMIPIVQNLINNSNLKIELTEENLILLCITILAVTYLEETNNKSGDAINSQGDESLVTKSDAQTMLEELKMRGIGNGIVKKLVKVFKHITKFIKDILHKTQYSVNSLMDMLGYTAILIPCMNAISVFVGKYELNMDTLIGNLASISLGLGAMAARRGMNWLVNKIKSSLNIKKEKDDLDVPTAAKPYEILDGETDNKEGDSLISERK